MPGGLVPHKSGAHRLACLSLYRALLKQCYKFSAVGPGSAFATDTLQSLVRYRFRKDRKLQSPSKINNGLQAGYHLFSLLKSSTGETTNVSYSSLKKLADVLASTSELADSTAAARARQDALRKPPPPSLDRRLKHFHIISTKANHTRRPDNPHILERPLPLSQIKSGKRLVPHLVSTQGFPFLRYAKPQPPALSRMIRQRTAWSERKWTQRHELEDQVVLAEMEDRWDTIVSQDFGIVDPERPTRVSSSPTPSPERDGIRSRSNHLIEGMTESWTHVPRQAISEIVAKMRHTDREAAEMGRRMWDIVLKEKELAAQERLQARLERKKAREEEKQKRASEEQIEENVSLA